MAVITPSSLISEIRGSVGDVTYSKNRYGPYVKAKLIQPASASADQILRRDALTEGVTAWQNMSDAEFIIWKNYVQQHLVSKNISRTIVRAAYNEFISRYVNRSLIGSALTGFPPGPFVKNFPTVTSVTQSPGSLLVNFTSLKFESDCDYVIYATPPLSSSIRTINKSAYKVLTYITPSSATDSFNIFTLYDAVYSLTSANVGNRIGIAIKAVNSDNYAGGKTSYSNFILDADVLATAPSILQARGLAQLNSATQVMSLVTAPTSGNLLVVIMGVVGNRTITPPAGWNSIVSKLEAAGTIHAFYKIAGGSETNSYSFSTNQTPDWQSMIYEVIDFSAASPIQFSSSNGSAGVSVNTIVAGAASQNVALNTLVLTGQRNASSVTGVTVNNSFADIVSAGTSCRGASRRYLSAEVTQNVTWSWTGNRTAQALFFGINPE